MACGAVGFDKIAEVAADLDADLTGAFGLVRSAPSSGTFRRVLNATDPVALDEALCRWAEPAVPQVRDAERVERVVSADRKTMRAARCRLESGRFAQDQVVEVLDHASGVVLACQEVDGGDEIGAVGQVASQLIDRWGSLAGIVLIADAKHTQHKLVDQVGGASGWWVLPVKENQPGIHARVTGQPWSDLKAAAVERGTGHGRQETGVPPCVRKCRMSGVDHGYRAGNESSRERRRVPLMRPWRSVMATAAWTQRPVASYSFSSDSGVQPRRLAPSFHARLRLCRLGRAYEGAGQHPIRVRLARIHAGQRVKPCHDPGFAP